MILQQTIERLYESSNDSYSLNDAFEAVTQLKDLLNRGEIRAAVKINGIWKVEPWVKKGILLALRIGNLREQTQVGGFKYFDKHTMSLRNFTTNDEVRIVPGGSTVRDGTHLARGVIIMPPSYVNIGAYIDEQTMIDSHVLVGSCAQIGKRVHIGAGTQIGGVLEPSNSLPVIVEDEVFIGGNCGIYEGVIIRHGAVIGAGVIITASTPVYDIVKREVVRKSSNDPIIIPENAVVVSGNRQIEDSFANDHRLSVYTPIIIKYRDKKTNAAVSLEKQLH